MALRAAERARDLCVAVVCLQDAIARRGRGPDRLGEFSAPRATLLPTTVAATMVTASHCVGFTLPGLCGNQPAVRLTSKFAKISLR